MPTLIETREIQLNWSDIYSRVKHPTPESYRSSGTHLSGVIRFIAQSLGLLRVEATFKDSASAKAENKNSILQDVDEGEFPLRMALGMAWEEWAAGLWEGMFWQPGEIERDGIFGNPDGMSELTYDTGRFRESLRVIEEFKLTWKSEYNYGKDKFLTSNWLWRTQGQGYCSMEHSGITHVRYHILWVNGDYRPPQPSYKTYLVRFSEKELESNWRMIVKYRDHPGVKIESH